MELQVLGGDFPVKIEQVGFDTEGGAVEGGADTDVGDRAATLGFALEESSCHIDAAGGQKLLLGLVVEGGEGEAAAGGGADDDFTGEREGTAEEPRGVGDVAGGDFAADHGARDDFFVAGQRWNDLDREAVERAQGAKQGDIAALLMTEAKILAYENGAHLQTTHENALDKVFGSDACEVQGERKHHGGLDAQKTKPLHTLSVGGKAQGSGFRAKDLAGRGIEGECGGHVARFLGAVDDGTQDGLMAEMDAVEIADGKNTAAAGGRIIRGPGFGAGEYSHGGGPCSACRSSAAGGLRRRFHFDVKFQ